MAAVVFVPHLVPCLACRRYVEDLSGTAEDLRAWATRALVLTSPDAAIGAVPGVALLDDTGGAGRAQAGVGRDEAAVIQADRWGAVYQAATVGPDAPHGRLPRPHELVALAKYIDIQCPECAIPSPEWLEVSPFPLG